ncbi:MAG: flagellar hook-length control protein FliK [Acetatifactor sp.]|nr:flagellar hook-length control protein FliK [Acetatifactor sp.]
MRLSQIFTGERQISDSGNIQNGPIRSDTIARQIRALMPGQTIQGEIVSRNGSDVLLKLTEDFLLNAKLEQNLNLEVGKNLVFEVKNNGKSLTLSPLFVNMATDANAVKALDMAGIVVNEKTLEMTRDLMQEGLPIDKQSLQTVYRESNLFPDTEVQDLVYLHKLEMPVNEQNVNQMSAYRNFTYQLEAGVNEVLDTIADVWTMLTDSGQMENVSFLEEQLQLFLNNETPLSTENEIGEERIPVPENMEISSGEGIVKELMANLDKQMEPAQIVHTQTAPAEMTSTESASGENAYVRAEHIQSEALPVEESAMEQTQETFMHVEPNQKETTLFREVLHANHRELPQKLLDLLDNLKQQWSVQPKDVADADKMTDFYRVMDKQLRALAQTLERVNPGNTGGIKTVNNLTQNLDFLHQVNQMYSYVQLPLRLQHGEAHGDLYVYTNKRNLAKQDGQVSALLHLDMEHLGPMDVYVVLKQENVNTKFYLQDDDLLDFINSHMDLLTQRLAKRGYQCSVTASVRDVEELKQGGIDKLLQDEGHMPISEFAFDVRT